MTVVSALAGCAAQPVQPAQEQHAPATAEVASSAIISSETETLTPEQLAQVMGNDQQTAYTLGPNDIISVSVYGHPELSAPPPGIMTTNGGVLITSDGSIDMPLIGQVNLNGMTIAQAQNAITADYASLVRQPNVTVQLVVPQSLRYYLLGAFTLPGLKYPGHVMTLLDALSLGGSVDIANADLYQAYVANGKVRLPVDLHALLVEGDLTQNILLSSGDDIVVPPATDEDAFVFGAIGKPGAVPFRSGSLSLLQALSMAGLDLPSYTAARLAHLHLIRAHGTSADLLVLDATKIMNGTAPDFPLAPGDIIFVPPSAVASWNQVLTMVTPSLETVSNLLNPFVSIKYLSQ